MAPADVAMSAYDALDEEGKKESEDDSSEAEAMEVQGREGYKRRGRIEHRPGLLETHLSHRAGQLLLHRSFDQYSIQLPF